MTPTHATDLQDYYNHVTAITNTYEVMDVKTTVVIIL